MLGAAEGKPNKDIAPELGCNPATVTKWRNRFAQRRLDGLHDEPRPGAPRKITDDDIEEVIVKTLESAPKNATHWSTRSMAAEVGMSQTKVSQIWRAFGLKGRRFSFRQGGRALQCWVDDDGDRLAGSLPGDASARRDAIAE